MCDTGAAKTEDPVDRARPAAGRPAEDPIKFSCFGVNAGYRHIDCASAYNNEKEVGSALKSLFEMAVVKREDMFITSKLWCSDHAPEDVPEALDSTLSDLQLDYLDLYLVKKDLHSEAQISIIFSTHRILSGTRPPAVNQVEGHPCWQQAKLRWFCQTKKVHLSAYSPLGSPGNSWVKGSNVLTHPIVKMVAEKLGKTPAQITLKWGLQIGQSVLPKSTNKARIQENIELFDWSIPDDLFAKFSEIEQARLILGDFIVHPQSVYKTLEDLWDEEI